MQKSGRVVFSQMDEVLFGKPAADAIADEARRLAADRMFLMVSGTLNRDTDEISRVRRALGDHCVGLFDKMPPHTPRSAVIAAAEQARRAGANLIVTIGGGSITDGANQRRTGRRHTERASGLSGRSFAVSPSAS